jgi:hypothetical protein
VGRNQTKEEAIKIDENIALSLNDMGVHYFKISYDVDLRHLRDWIIGLK